MTTLIASFVVLALAVAAMAVGVLLGRAPIRGSCGGVGGAGCACTASCEGRSAEDRAGAASRGSDAC